MKQTAAKGSTAKHAGAGGKTGPTGKHTPARQKPAPAQQGRRQNVVGKQAGHAKARQLSPGDVACCSAEALGASLRLAGHRVTGDDVLALHVAAGGGVDAGVPILAVLEAASASGLAGVQPHWFGPLEPGGDVLGQHGETESAGHDSRRGAALDEPAARLDAPFPVAHGLILGVELPGAHAVTIAPDGCWLSWGAHHDPAGWPDAVIEEAWAVTWP